MPRRTFLPRRRRTASTCKIVSLLGRTSVFSSSSYDHLAHCITKLLTERTGLLRFSLAIRLRLVALAEDAANAFEEISRHVKSEATRAQHDTLRDRPAQASEHRLAEEQKPLFEVTGESDDRFDTTLFYRKPI